MVKRLAHVRPNTNTQLNQIYKGMESEHQSVDSDEEQKPIQNFISYRYLLPTKASTLKRRNSADDLQKEVNNTVRQVTPIPLTLSISPAKDLPKSKK